jgi:hypothetical protein
MRKTNFSKSSLSACNARPVHTDGPGTAPARSVFESQRGRQHPIGKASITDADPLKVRIEHRAAVVHAGHPLVDRDAKIGDPEE